jgi:Ser/Thr protein kinase RdoA (MazF antagonist)
MKRKGGGNVSGTLAEIAEWTGEQRLAELLRHHYGLKLTGAEPVGGVLKCITDEGMFALKRIRRGERNRWELFGEVARHVNGAKDRKVSVPAPLFTDAGHTRFDGYRFAYGLLPWMEAEPIRLETAGDWHRASRRIARLHRLTRDFVSSRSRWSFRPVGTWTDQMKRAEQQLSVFRLAAKWTPLPTDADRTWAEASGFVTGLMENVRRYVDAIGVEAEKEETASLGRVCHQNLHRRNLLSDRNGTCHVVDWNSVTLDSRTNDLARWVAYAYGRTGSKAVLRAALHGYHETWPLEEAEWAQLYARLLFPENILNILEKVYDQQTLSLEEAAPLLKRATEREEKKMELIRAYADTARESFGVSVPLLDWVHQ